MPPPAKKRRVEKTTAVEEITFDPSLRHDYLTGFHKRKLQRASHAREIAARRAREDKIKERAQLRAQRKEDVERHVRDVNAMLRGVESDGEKTDGEDGEGEGIQEETVVVEPVDHEAEYVDEEKYTTVTVEEMDVTKDGLSKASVKMSDEGDEKDEQDKQDKAKDTSKKKKKDRPWTKGKPKDQDKKPKKKRNFRYENKAERKFTRSKQKARNSKQARERRAG